MLPIRIIETSRDDFDGPVIELWRDDEFVGLVFWDGESTILQVYPDGEGDVHDLDVRELQMLLDTAVRIVDPDAFDEEMDELRSATKPEEWGDEHPATVELLAGFDERATHRSDDGEGYFDPDVAGEFIDRCEELDLAVTEMDGLRIAEDTITPIDDRSLEVPDQPMMTWTEFRSFANRTAHQALSDWRSDSDMVFAFVFRQPDGEEIVA